MSTMKTELKTSEIEIQSIAPLFSVRRLAEYFDLRTETGEPANETVLDWYHSGRIPPPDIKLSRKAIYWKPETIKNFIEIRCL